MNRNYAIAPRAEEDLSDLYAFIAQGKISPADKFLLIAHQSFQRLADMPSLGLQWRSSICNLRELHWYPMPSPFRNYLIFYRPTRSGIEVLTVFQGSAIFPWRSAGSIDEKFQRSIYRRHSAA